MRVRSVFITAWLSVALAGCAAHRPPAPAAAIAPSALAGDPAHPGQTQGWVDTKLYFGLGPSDHLEQGVSETRWLHFLDKEVTSRFPDGLSVVDVYGQWQGKTQSTPERLRTKMIILLYPDSPENRTKIEAIRSAWKQFTGDQSVLRVTEPADVSF